MQPQCREESLRKIRSPPTDHCRDECGFSHVQLHGNLRFSQPSAEIAIVDSPGVRRPEAAEGFWECLLERTRLGATSWAVRRAAGRSRRVTALESETGRTNKSLNTSHLKRDTQVASTSPPPATCHVTSICRYFDISFECRQFLRGDARRCLGRGGESLMARFQSSSVVRVELLDNGLGHRTLRVGGPSAAGYQSAVDVPAPRPARRPGGGPSRGITALAGCTLRWERFLARRAARRSGRCGSAASARTAAGDRSWSSAHFAR
jgi:hypothetical protein